ncbi:MULTISPECIES: response regulator [unclassified Sedimentibacter]|uniref:response regulator n=1 Tax=unclassified Sedimentibacter TaxID=2649220 RepID=UPI0027DEEEA7|nr:response regulator [Sedimentibacter sp. MB35-C1]WMJ77717.1 response regulator [Sedimentibacter sp. MB35-C1]
MSNILVVDDERPIAEIIKYNLQKEGFTVQTAYDGEEAIKMVRKINPELIILDIMLPKKNGFEVLREIRMEYMMPVIMLTAKEEENDKITGLELGADDYITKPFSNKELIARVRANLRRVKLSSTNEEMKAKIINVGNLTIDMNTYEVSRDNDIIDLTNREFDLLKYLFLNSDRVFNREHLLKEVWGYEFGDLRTVDVTVRRLREKIETENDKYIITKRGTGYYFKSR